MRASSRSVAATAKRALQGAVKTFRSGRYFRAVLDEQQDRVGEDEGERDERHLLVELGQGVDPKGCRHRFEPGDEGELQAHHRQPHEPERDRELDHERATSRRMSGGDDEKRGERDQQVHQHPEHPGQCVLHAPRPPSPSHSPGQLPFSSSTGCQPLRLLRARRSDQSERRRRRPGSRVRSDSRTARRSR
jgi:hypothetical protein